MHFINRRLPCPVKEINLALYDHIGNHYDITRRADPALLARLRAHLQPRPQGRYLDLACGTGNYTRALADSGVSVCGLDASPTMLAALRAKAKYDNELGDYLFVVAKKTLSD